MNPSEPASSLDVSQEDLLASSGDHAATISGEDDRTLSVKGRDQVGGPEAGSEGRRRRSRRGELRPQTTLSSSSDQPTDLVLSDRFGFGLESIGMEMIEQEGEWASWEKEESSS